MLLGGGLVGEVAPPAHALTVGDGQLRQGVVIHEPEKALLALQSPLGLLLGVEEDHHLAYRSVGCEDT